MFKKLSAVVCSCITVLLLLLSLMGGSVYAATASLDEMTSTAISCIMSHEGSYGSVNRNDCGACSIGKLQISLVTASLRSYTAATGSKQHSRT